MKILFFVLLLTFGNVHLGHAQESASVRVQVQDIESSASGPLVIMLFASADGFPIDPAQAIRKGTVTANSARANYTFEDVPVGRYAVAVFQDENENGTVDSNFLGIPKEPVGASNHTRLGRPNFSRCAFQHGTSSPVVTVKLLNQ